MVTGKSELNLNELIEASASQASVALAAAQVAQLATHLRLLLLWNRKINLSAVRQPAEIASRHFGESLFLTTLLDEPARGMVDVGSGAGFPGLPLKVRWPSAPAVLLEPNQKKAAFLNEVIRQCELGGIRVEASRLEDAVRGPLAGASTLVTMRAVAVDEPVLQALGELLHPGGRVALFLGAGDAGRVAQSGQFRWEPPCAIPGSDQRVILIGGLLRG